MDTHAMFSRDNWPGIALLGLCGLVAIALLIEIFTDVRWEFNGPNWLGNGIAIVGFGIILFMSWRAWGHRLRGRGKQDPEWPKNDVRNQKRRKDENEPAA
jgi:hypothetical protein